MFSKAIVTVVPVVWRVVVQAATLTVDLNGTAQYTTIQSAIDAAADGDTVLVKPGEYVITEPINFNRLHDQENPDSPPVKNIVARSEGGAELTTIRMSETPANPERASVVVFENVETNASLLEGFTISGGQGTWGGGGGILCTNSSSPTLTNCTISGNFGSGVYCCSGSSPILTNCTISGNSGSGVYCYNSSPTLTDCTISGNSGGGVYCWDSSPILTNCTISGNSGIAEELGIRLGGGVICQAGSSPALISCTISGNSADIGGGVYCWNSSPILTNCTISGNSGGGVYCGEDSSPTLTNCTISGNSGLYGGGVHCGGGCSPALISCTISGNSARKGGGVSCSGESSPILKNCIVWGNSGGSLDVDQTSQPNVSFSCLETEEVWPGEGNSNANPSFCGWEGPSHVFVDALNASPGDGTEGNPFRELSSALRYSLSLQRDSPCLGMGAEAGVCDEAGAEERVVHVGPGRYGLEGLCLAQGASILGAGEDETVLEGTVWGLRTGAVLSRVTVTGGEQGGIVVDIGGSPSIDDCTITGNWSFWSPGGGVYCGENASPALRNCTITGNSTGVWKGADGGGVYCGEDSSPTLTNCTISGNQAVGGGGVFCWAGSSPALISCTISGNSADGGGGVYCSLGSSPILTNCAISGNSGSGVSCYGSSSMTLTNCTISGNMWGAVHCVEASSPTLTNCILWGNFLESLCGTLSHCLTDQDPLFVKEGAFDFGRWKTVRIGRYEVRLPDFVVGEPDYHLRQDSPAIDAGTSEGAPTTDIEGIGRPCGAGVDIGAYEFGRCPANFPKFKRGDPNSDNKIDVADAVHTLSYLFAHGPAASCLDGADANDDGKMNIADAIAILSHLFANAGPLPAPFGECGIDPTVDGLDCGSYESCT